MKVGLNIIKIKNSLNMRMLIIILIVIISKKMEKGLTKLVVIG